MADNKKTKVDWKDALSGMAVDPEDFIDVEVDGQVTKIYRGQGKKRLSDAQWAEAKKNAVKPKDETTSDPGMSVRGQMMKTAQGATPRGATSTAEPLTREQADQKYAEEYEGSKYVVPQEAKEIAGAVKKGAAAVSRGAKEAGKAAEYVGGKAYGGVPMSSAEIQKEDAIARRDPGVDFDPALAADPASLRGPAQAAVERANAMTRGSEGLASTVPPRLATPSTWDKVKGVAGEALQALNPFAPSDIPPAEMDAIEGKARMDPGVEVDPTLAPPTPPVPPDAAMPPVAPLSPDGSGSQSSSVSASISPPVTVPDAKVVSGGDGGVGKAMKELDANNKTLRAAHDEYVSTREKMAQDNERMRLQTMKDMETANQQAIQAKLTAVEESKRYMTAQQATLAAAREAASSPIDPNRYWNNKNEGQKAMAVVAGALFGFTGQGMNWLQRLDGLVEADNRLQAQDRASKVQGLQAEAQGLGQLGEIAMRNGATIAEARLMEKQGKYEQLQVFLQNTAEKASNAELKVKAAQMSQDLSKEQVGIAMQLAQLSELRASHITQANLKKAELQMEAQKMNASIRIAEAKAAGDNGLQPMKPAQQERLAEVRSVAGHLRNMWKDYNRLATSVIPGKPGATSVLPENISDSARWNGSKADQYTQLIGKPLEGGVVREQDTARYRKSYIPNATDVEGLAKEKVRTLIEYAAGKYESEYRTMRDAGVDMRTTATPEQFRKELEASTFSPAPAYATEK